MDGALEALIAAMWKRMPITELKEGSHRGMAHISLEAAVASGHRAWLAYWIALVKFGKISFSGSLGFRFIVYPRVMALVAKRTLITPACSPTTCVA